MRSYKIVLAVLLLTVTLNAVAQSVHYTGRIEGMFTTGLHRYDDDRWIVGTVHGVTFGGERWFVGAGFGIGHSIGDDQRYYPLFLDIRYSFPKEKLQPFLGVQGGVRFDNKTDFDGGPNSHGKGSGDQFIIPKIGIRFPVRKRLKINVSLGYEFSNGNFYRGSFERPKHVGKNGVMVAAGIEF